MSAGMALRSQWYVLIPFESHCATSTPLVDVDGARLEETYLESVDSSALVVEGSTAAMVVSSRVVRGQGRNALGGLARRANTAALGSRGVDVALVTHRSVHHELAREARGLLHAASASAGKNGSASRGAICVETHWVLIEFWVMA